MGGNSSILRRSASTLRATALGRSRAPSSGAACVGGVGATGAAQDGERELGANADAREVYEMQERVFHAVFEMGEELGSGSFSVVRYCRDRRDGRPFAVKCVNLQRLVPEDQDALNNEIRILTEISHPHIVQLVEVFREAEMCYLVMELVGGGELFDRVVRRTSYPEATARHLTRLLLMTVQYLHAHNVVHRDIKPENLLLVDPEDDCQIKIADFGFAEHISNLGEYSAVCGTPQYVAPEILQGHRYGATVDIWSLGVVTFVLLGGYPPFYDREKKQLFRKIVRGAYEFHSPFWDHISQDAKDFIRCMLVVDARSRLSATQLLEHRWLKGPSPEGLLSLQQAPGYIGADPSAAHFRDWVARRRLRAAVLAVMAVNRLRNHRKLAAMGVRKVELPRAVALAPVASAAARSERAASRGASPAAAAAASPAATSAERPVPMLREDAGESWLAPLRYTDNVQLFRWHK